MSRREGHRAGRRRCRRRPRRPSPSARASLPLAKAERHGGDPPRRPSPSAPAQRLREADADPKADAQRTDEPDSRSADAVARRRRPRPHRSRAEAAGGHRPAERPVGPCAGASTCAARRARRGWSATTSAASPCEEARAILASPAWRRARLVQGARVSGRQRGAQPRARRRRSDVAVVPCRRGSDDQALPPAREGSRDADPQAHQPPHDQADAEGVARMGQKVHPEGMRVGYIHDWKSNWFTERHFADYLQEDEQHPQPHHRQALARGPVGHHDPQERERGRGQHPHRPSGHRDRQVRLRGRRAASRPAPAHGQGR